MSVPDPEMDQLVDRERTRMIVVSAADILVNACLNAAPDYPLDLERLFQEFKNHALPAIREYRMRAKRRIANFV